jgi:hypothetical protein
MPRKKIVKPMTVEDHAAAFARRLVRNTAFHKSNAVVEIEWFQDGLLGLGDGYFVKFINKRAIIPAKYLRAAESHGCRRVDVSRETDA